MFLVLCSINFLIVDTLFREKDNLCAFSGGTVSILKSKHCQIDIKFQELVSACRLACTLYNHSPLAFEPNYYYTTIYTFSCTCYPLLDVCMLWVVRHEFLERCPSLI